MVPRKSEEQQRKNRLAHPSDSGPYEFRNAARNTYAALEDKTGREQRAAGGKRAYQNGEQQGLDFGVSQDFFIQEDVRLRDRNFPKMGVLLR